MVVIDLLQLKGFSKDGSQRFRFHCHLSAFQKDSNNFTKELAPYLDDAHRFCVQLEQVTSGTITDESTPPPPPEHCKPSSSGQGRKRAHGNKPQATAPKKKKKELPQGARELSENLQAEINLHQIGKYRYTEVMK